MDKEIKVLVPDRRVPEFYEMYGRWLANEPKKHDAEEESIREEWSPQDLENASWLYEKLSDRARSVFDLLIGEPGRWFTVKEIAEHLELGEDEQEAKYIVAGIFAWPGRYCLQIQREWTWKWQADEEGGVYSMTPEMSDLFSRARAEVLTSV